LPSNGRGHACSRKDKAEQYHGVEQTVFGKRAAAGPQRRRWPFEERIGLLTDWQCQRSINITMIITPKPQWRLERKLLDCA
jgi:hypothetical protein